MPVKQAALT